MTFCFVIYFFSYPIIIIFYPIHLSFKEELQELSSNNLIYDVSNVSQIYHPTYIDTNINSSGGFALPVFYEPKSYKYSSKSFVPNYVDTIYMSSLTGLSNVSNYYDISNTMPTNKDNK